MLMFLSMMILYSFFFLLFKHPLSCGLMLLMQTIMIAVISGMMNYNYWYSYILFLIMIGGMLILFIYMTSIASNEKFKFNSKMLMIFLILSMLNLILMFMDKFYFNFLDQIIDMKNQPILIMNNLSMLKYMNKPNNFVMMIMIIYLFITLIAIVKITKNSSSSLRQKF